MLGFTISCQSKSPGDRRNNNMTGPFIGCPKQVQTSWQMFGRIYVYMYIYTYKYIYIYIYIYTHIYINQQRSTHEGSGLQQTPPKFTFFSHRRHCSLVFTDPKILFSWWWSIWPTVYEVSITMTYRQSCIYHAWNTRSKIRPVWKGRFGLNGKNTSAEKGGWRLRKGPFATGVVVESNRISSWSRGPARCIPM